MQKKKKSVRKLHKDTLSQLVVNYRKTRDNELFREIIKISWGLPVKLLMQFTSSPVFNDYERDEYLREMRTVILLESINSYKQTKSRFSTHYYWQLKHYLSDRVKKSPKNSTDWNEVNRIAAINRKRKPEDREQIPYRFRFFQSIEGLQTVNKNFDIACYDKLPNDVTRAYIYDKLDKLIDDKFALKLFKELYFEDEYTTLRILGKKYNLSHNGVNLKIQDVKKKLKRALLKGEIL